MEDLDPHTSNLRHEQSQLDDLAALGIDWDEVPVRQSERFDAYGDAIADLTRSGLLYPCYCTRREIAEAVTAPNSPTPTDGYPGTCRELSRSELDRRVAESRPAALRLRADAVEIDFIDELRGETTGRVDDVVVQRNDGVASYNLAVVVDDAAQGVDLVVRGDDLLESTPRQIHLGELLGLPRPRYAHVPLVLGIGPDGTPRRLAKRDGAVTLSDRRRLGDTPGAVVSALAGSLGLDPLNGDPLAAAYVDRFGASLLSSEPLVLSAGRLALPLPWPT